MKKISDAQLKRYEETDRLLAAHNVYRQEWYASTVAGCARPDELMRILRYIREMDPSAERDFIARLADLDWILNASDDVRFAVLRVIAKRVDKLYGELDDPLPPRTNMFFEARKILGVR
jgi:hypothetical protein